jgi:hypothetical protein
MSDLKTPSRREINTSSRFAPYSLHSPLQSHRDSLNLTPAKKLLTWYLYNEAQGDDSMALSKVRHYETAQSLVIGIKYSPRSHHHLAAGFLAR